MYDRQRKGEEGTIIFFLNHGDSEGKDSSGERDNRAFADENCHKLGKFEIKCLGQPEQYLRV